MRSFLLILALSCIAVHQIGAATPYKWICQDKKCVQRLPSQLNGTTGQPMDVCKLTCDDYASLWPYPTGAMSVSKTLQSINITSISLENLSSNPLPIQSMLTEAINIFKGFRYFPPAVGAKATTPLRINIGVTSDSTIINHQTDESYNLTIAIANNVATADIKAPTYFGARHALETLSQLIVFHKDLGEYQIVNTASIVDKPVFHHRSVMLDTSRNFIGVDKLKELIDGMSYNKLNIFHWHLTDSHSWPMQVPSRPKMTEYGAYDSDKIFTVAQMTDLVAYARQRGVKIIPEIDQPAHSGFGYQWGAEDGLGDLVVCLEKDPWYDFCVEPPCGQLNLVNPNVTIVFGDILNDMMKIFDKDIFHMGGDEVDMRCYNSSPVITDWMNANGYPTSNLESFFKLWSEFQQKLLDKLYQSTGTTDTKAIIWNSGLTAPERIENYVDKDKYILQIWTDRTDAAISSWLQKGYKAYFANWDSMYIDCGWQAWIGNGHNWCSPMKGWQHVYNNDPQQIYANLSGSISDAEEAIRSGQILGAEVVLWVEQADENAVTSRIWPRAAAHAERVWSHPKTTSAEAEFRMMTTRDRLVARGILADSLQPKYCVQNQGKCHP